MATKANESEFPRIVFILSGKRKSGKDYIAEMMKARFGPDRTVILRLSGPLKKQYAMEHNLDFEKLLDATSYKETFREDMIVWGEEIRRHDPGYFCRHTIDQNEAYQKPVWIVSDARRKTDLAYFKEKFGNIVKAVRITADEDEKVKRGWIYTKGIDDAESECGLDDYQDWDFVVHNNEHDNDREQFLGDAERLVLI